VSGPAAAPYESPLLRQAIGPALRPGGLALTERALDRCDFPPGARVLDLGCGLGASAGRLAASRDLRVLGLDLSSSMLAAARRAHHGLPLVRARAEAVPLAGGSLNGVLCECVLSLTASPRAVLEECRRLLRPGGRLVLSDLYLREPPADGPVPSLPGCLGGALGRESLEALVAAAGLEVLLWEDHSDLLGQLTARLVWTCGSAAAFWEAWAGGAGCGNLAARAAKVRPGYFLMLAQRREAARG